MLVLSGVGVTAVPRPLHRLWRRVHAFDASKMVLLWQDGRTLEVVDPLGYRYDDALQNGNLVEPGSWQEAVLRGAGYTLEGPTDPAPPDPTSGVYPPFYQPTY